MIDFDSVDFQWGEAKAYIETDGDDNVFVKIHFNASIVYCDDSFGHEFGVQEGHHFEIEDINILDIEILEDEDAGAMLATIQDIEDALLDEFEANYAKHVKVYYEDSY